MYISRLDYLLTGLMCFFTGIHVHILFLDLKKSWNDELKDEGEDSDSSK